MDEPKAQHRAVCCGTPLIGTMIFPKAEWFCRKCKSTYGMFDVVLEIVTLPQIKEEEENYKWFSKIAKDYIPPGSRRRDCPECKKAGEHHSRHMTEAAKEISRQAYVQLMSGQLDKQ